MNKKICSNELKNSSNEIVQMKKNSSNEKKIFQMKMTKKIVKINKKTILIR